VGAGVDQLPPSSTTVSYVNDGVLSCNADIAVCAPIPDANNDGVLDGTNVTECDIRSLHGKDGVFKDSTGTIGDGTCPVLAGPSNCPYVEALGGVPCIDAINNEVCASVDSLSPLLIALSDDTRRFPHSASWGCSGALR
jgi:hypothetical protein